MLHSDKDHQILFVGGSNMRKAKHKMADGRQFKKSKKGQTSATVWQISTKFGIITHIDPPKKTASQLKFEFLKIQDDGRPPFLKVK